MFKWSNTNRDTPMQKILFVEDDPMISEIYCRKFKDSGFDVVPAVMGREVLQKVAQEGPFDLVLLDIVLPEMSGLEVLREFRRSGKYDPALKVIMFSNLQEQEERKQALDLGVNGFVSKIEYSPSKLVEEVSRFLRQFEEQERNQKRADDISTGVKSPKPLGKRILLIEDEEVFADMFSRRLSEEGYEVVVADNGASGIEAAHESRFDLIITDMVLPGLSGKEVLRMLKSDEDLKDIPVFLFSASIDADELHRIACEGAEQCFMKTRITPTELTREVNLVLKNS